MKDEPPPGSGSGRARVEPPPNGPEHVGAILERGSKFDEQWEAAYAAAFPPPPQQNQAEIELAIATIREENQQQVAALREQFERAMNQLMRSVHQQSQDQQKNIVPMRPEPEQPEPSPSPKPKAKPKKTKPQTTETREGVGVDRDEPV
jgi:hypothetical protein